RNSYDNVPIYGFSAYVNTKWMSAITSAIAGAKILGDSAAEKKYSEVLEKGKDLFDEKLWTGEYYRLYNNEGGKEHPGMNEGCLTDQIVGQWTNQLSGLDDIYPKARVKQVLQTIMDLSYKPGFGLRNGSWPGDDFYHVVVRDPALPGYMYECDQLNIFWSGTELAFASFLIYEDMYDQALDVIKTVDDRYRKAGRYWDHQEWGGHYYRAMSAWSVINALLGLTINQEVYSFSPKVPQDNFKLFFAFPGGTAFFTRSVNGTDRSVTIEVLSGQFLCKQLNYSGPGIEEKDVNVLIDNEPVQDVIKKTDISGLNLSIDFNKTTTINTGQTLQIDL
ncbi:MAG: glycoside hydrolase family 116 protein, partial [Bacteroidales bacterium]|nr:glycoside hydrolase family 116 protein [Bacteroidales bacterium]